MFSFARFTMAGALRRPLVFVIPLALGIGAVGMMADEPSAPPAANQNGGGSSLTVEQLGEALDSYGKNTSTNNGQTDYSVTVTRGKWNINLIISISPNGKMIWMTNNLTAMPDKASPDGLVNVLKKNTEIGPAFFSIADGSLRLSWPVANYDLNATAIHAQVEAMVSTVLDTEPLWRPDALGVSAGAK
jgi:hypothetical protein